MSANNPFDGRVVGLLVDGTAIVDRTDDVPDDVFEIVINLGTQDGFEAGNRLLVYSLGPEIIDPDSGESLGHFEVVKGIGKIAHAQPRQSTVKSQETKLVLVKKPINALLGPAGGMTEESSRRQAPFRAPKIGDYVRSV